MAYKVISPDRFGTEKSECVCLVENKDGAIMMYVGYDEIEQSYSGYSNISHYLKFDALDTFFVEDEDIDLIATAIMLLNQSILVLYKPAIKPIFTIEEKHKTIKLFLRDVLLGFHPDSESIVVDQKILDLFQPIWDMFGI